MNYDDDKVSESAKLIKTNMIKPPILDDLKQDLQDALPSHNAYVTKLQEWDSNLFQKNKVHKAKNKSTMQSKLIRKQAEWTYPDISEPFLNTPLMFDTTPKTSQDVDAAKQNRVLLNHQFNTKVNKVRLIDTLARTLVNQGTAILHTGWNFQEKVVEEEVPDFAFQRLPPYSQEEQVYQLLSNGTEIPNITPDIMIGFRKSQQLGYPVKAIPNGTRIVQKTVKVHNHPTVTISDNSNIIIDPMAQGDVENAKFIIIEFDISKADMHAQSGRYHNIESVTDASRIDNVTGDVSNTTSNKESDNFNYKDDIRTLHKAYEYHGFGDIYDTGILESFVCTWVGEVMVRLETNPVPHNGLPFTIIQYMPKFDENHGEPDGELIKDNQKIMGVFSRGLIDVMSRSANGQRGIRADALDPVNAIRFKRGQDFEYRPSIDPRTLFHTFKFDELPPSALHMMAMQQAEAESLSGTKSFGAEGISGDSYGSQSAAGVKGVLSATSKRRMSILRRVAAGLEDVGRKIIGLNSVMLSDEEVVRVTDQDFVAIKRDDLRGDFDLTLQISTAEHDDSRAQELAFMLQTSGANTDPAETRIVRAKIARLRNMPDLADQIENYKPEPDPMAIEKAKLELELLKAQIANEIGKGNENNANGQLDIAKIGTEQAKANKLQSEADAIDLNYIEGESGVTQERQKELAVINHSNNKPKDK